MANKKSQENCKTVFETIIKKKGDSDRDKKLEGGLWGAAERRLEEWHGEVEVVWLREGNGDRL